MSLLAMLNFTNQRENLLHSLDARSKIIFALTITILSLLSSDLIILLFYFIIVNLILWRFLGSQQILSLIYNMKYFIILLLVIMYLVGQAINLNVGILILKILNIILAFIVLNRTTKPTQIVDALIKSKIPPQIAWTAGASLRQSIFLTEDVYEIMQIHEIRENFEKKDEIVKIRIFNNLKSKITKIVPLISATMSIAVLNAKNFGDMLIIRGWEGAHSEITMNTSSFSKTDYIFILLTIIFPILITLSFAYVKEIY